MKSSKFFVIALAFLCFTRLVAEEPALNTTTYSRVRLSNRYSPHSLHLIGLVYGTENILSEGGCESVDQMFKGIDLSEKLVLDVGCGFGGVDFYLAKQWNVTIIGAECEPYMTTKANQYLATEDALLGKVSFFTLRQPTALSELSDNAFDLVFSKEMLYNIANSEKQGYIQEMVRVLKPGGKLILADWLTYPEGPLENLKKAIVSEGFCHFLNLDQYVNTLKNAGLTEIQIEDMSASHLDFSIANIERIYRLKEQICLELGEETYRTALRSWTMWKAAIEHGELLSYVLTAVKPQDK